MPLFCTLLCRSIARIRLRCFLLHLQKARERCAQAERLRIGSVNTADHRLGHALECFFAKPAPHKTRKAFIVCAICAFSWQQQVRSHAKLAGDTENVARDKRPQTRRRKQLKPFGNRPQPPISDDETASLFFVCLDQPRLETESFGERERLRFFGNERVGAALEEKAVAIFRFDRAAETI